MRRLDGGAGCGARATVRTRVSGTPRVCRPPQLSGAAQSKGLDVGRTNAGQSPQEPVGSDPARIDNSICPRPGSYGPGERNRRGYGAPQGARVSARTEMRSVHAVTHGR